MITLQVDRDKIGVGCLWFPLPDLARFMYKDGIELFFEGEGKEQAIFQAIGDRQPELITLGQPSPFGVSVMFEADHCEVFVVYKIDEVHHVALTFEVWDDRPLAGMHQSYAGDYYFYSQNLTLNQIFGRGEELENDEAGDADYIP